MAVFEFNAVVAENHAVLADPAAEANVEFQRRRAVVAVAYSQEYFPFLIFIVCLPVKIDLLVFCEKIDVAVAAGCRHSQIVEFHVSRVCLAEYLGETDLAKFICLLIGYELIAVSYNGVNLSVRFPEKCLEPGKFRMFFLNCGFDVVDVKHFHLN